VPTITPMAQEFAAAGTVKNGICHDTSSPGCRQDWSYAKILRSHSGNPGNWELLNGENGWDSSSATIRNTQAIFKGHLYPSNWTAWWGNGNGLYRFDN
jgi:hypothetical protein